MTSPIVKAEGGVIPVIGYAAVYADTAKISGAAYADLLTAEQASFQSRTSERPKLFVPIFDHRAVTELSTRVAAQDARIAGLEAIARAAVILRRAYWKAFNSAAGFSNLCEESGSARKCERELTEAEALFRGSGFDALIKEFAATEKSASLEGSKPE